MTNNVSESPEETEAAGAALARDLRPGDVVALIGELGSGKTVYARGIARGLGVTEPVTSPTYALMHIYKCAGGTLCHMDLYRLESMEQVVLAGLDEFLSDPASIKIVEWAGVLGEKGAGPRFRVDLESAGGDRRSIQMRRPAGRGIMAIDQ